MKIRNRLILIHCIFFILVLPSYVWALDSAGYSPLGVSAAITGGNPIGSIAPWPSTTPPDGWLECNGQTFSASVYPELKVLLGVNRVPDLRGEFIRGWDHGRGVDSGRSIKSWQVDMFKSHTHKTPVDLSEGYNTAATDASDSGRPDGYAETSATGGPETRPRNVAMMYIIKAR